MIGIQEICLCTSPFPLQYVIIDKYSIAESNHQIIHQWSIDHLQSVNNSIDRVSTTYHLSLITVTIRRVFCFNQWTNGERILSINSIKIYEISNKQFSNFYCFSLAVVIASKLFDVTIVTCLSVDTLVKNFPRNDEIDFVI